MKDLHFVLGPFLLIAAVSLVYSYNTELKKRCDKSVSASLNIPQIDVHYFRGSCFVLDNRKKKFDETECKHLPFTGFLALLPGNSLVNTFYDTFRAFMASTGNQFVYFGFKRNDSTSPAGSRDVYYWYINDQKRWYAPQYYTKWKSSEPNDGGMTCGHLGVVGTSVTIYNVPCTSAFTYLCQYRDMDLGFKSVKKGVRGVENATIAQFVLDHQMKCARECAYLEICQSYTHSVKWHFCALHFLPTDELPTEPMDGAILFDLANW